MLCKKPVMGWNSWNTFAKDINETLIMEIADTMVSEGYLEAGYEYVIIDDCWSLKERVNGKLVADPALFPHGIKYLADYIHSKGLKFGMYSCAGVLTCAGYPSSYGYEYEDAKQFAEWGVDYLKYDFCNFPESADCKTAYLTMAMALRNCGRDIVFAACNWGEQDPAKWMRSHGAHTYRSTGDIHDNRQSFVDIFKSQYHNVEGNAPGCFNDMDMLIVGMHGDGHVGLGGCTSREYLMHFAMWAVMGSPLIIGGDIRNMSEEDKAILLNKGLIAINQDEDQCPPFPLESMARIHLNKMYAVCRMLSGGRFMVAVFNTDEPDQYCRTFIPFDDLGIHSNTPRSVRLTNAVTGEVLGVFRDAYYTHVPENECLILLGELIEEETK